MIVASGAYAQANLSSFDFQCSQLDSKGTLWFGSEGEGLWKVQGNTLIQHTVPGHSPRTNYYDLTTDPQGHLWLGTDNGIVEFDYQTWKDIPMTAPYVAATQRMAATADEKKRQVHGLSVNHSDHVLMAVEDDVTGQNLLMRFNGQTYVDLIKPFKSHEVYEDLDARLWMGNGAYVMEGGKLVSKVTIPGVIIQCALQDSRGDVWLGIDGAGVYRYDGSTMRHYGSDHGFESMRITCMHEDKSGRVWMGTELLSNPESQGLSYFESGVMHHLQEAATCPVKSVNTIASDKKGMVWFAGNDGALYRYNGRTFLVVDTSKMLGGK
jgi:ligand-binding sensor domain-containing protein